MTMEEAKAYYKSYHGMQFQMGRGEPIAYNEFKRLAVPEETLAAWDKELIDEDFRELWEDPDKVWMIHSRIIGVLRRGRVDVPAEVARLLDEMEKMVAIDGKNRLLLIENMAGRDQKMQCGGIYVICTRTDLGGRMKDIMDRMIAAGEKDADVPKEDSCREIGAKLRYRAAMHNFYKGET